MMVLPTKWWLLGGGLLLTLWLVWQAPSEPDNKIKVIEALQPISNPGVSEIDTQPHYKAPVKRQSSEMVSNLFRTPSLPNVPKTSNSSAKKTLPPLPFRYIGRMEKDESVTVFVMDGEVLHLLQAGDSPRVDYQLEAIDLTAKELRWRYLPTRKIRNMSIKP